MIKSLYAQHCCCTQIQPFEFTIILTPFIITWQISMKMQFQYCYDVIFTRFPISTLYESMVIFMYCFIKTDTPWFEFTVILAPLLAVTIFHGKTSWILLQNIPLLLFCRRTGWRLDGFQAIDCPPGFDNYVMEKMWSLMRDLTFSCVWSLRKM